MTTEDTSFDVFVDGKSGRDNGKRYRVKEVAPIVMAGIVLRLLSALRLASQDDLFAFLQPSGDDQDVLAAIMRLLTGCDPVAVHALITDALRYVEVAPDPQHPGMFRALRVEDDIREMSTLGDLLGAFAKLNLLPA